MCIGITNLLNSGRSNSLSTILARLPNVTSYKELVMDTKELHEEWVEVARAFAKKCAKAGANWRETAIIMECRDDEWDEEVLNPNFEMELNDG